MRYILVFILLICLGLNTEAQSPYQLDWKKEVGVFGSSALMFGLNYGVKMKISPLDESEIKLLDKNDVNAIDRFACDNWSEQAALRSDIGLYGAPAIAITTSAYYAFAHKDSPFINDALTLSVLWLETNLLTYGLTELSKRWVLRTRPFVYNPNAPLHEKIDIDARKSFFSGHTSIAAANSFFAAKVFSDYYPDSKWNPYIWGLAAALPAWTAWERIQAGKHFPTDVLVGYTIGALCGYLIPQLHKKKIEKESAVSFYPMGGASYNGLSFVWRI